MGWHATCKYLGQFTVPRPGDRKMRVSPSLFLRFSSTVADTSRRPIAFITALTLIVIITIQPPPLPAMNEMAGSGFQIPGNQILNKTRSSG